MEHINNQIQPTPFSVSTLTHDATFALASSSSNIISKSTSFGKTNSNNAVQEKEEAEADSTEAKSEHDYLGLKIVWPIKYEKLRKEISLLGKRNLNKLVVGASVLLQSETMDKWVEPGPNKCVVCDKQLSILEDYVTKPFNDNGYLDVTWGRNWKAGGFVCKVHHNKIERVSRLFLYLPCPVFVLRTLIVQHVQSELNCS